MEVSEAAIDSDEEVQNSVKSPAKRPRGRPRKDFNELGATQKRTRLDAAFKLCTQLAKEMGITMNEVLGNIGKRHYFGENYDKDYGQMYDKISKNENPFAENKMSVDKALYLKETCDMNREQWETWRAACKGEDLPSRYAMDNLKKKLLPNHYELAAGVRYGLGQTLSSTVKRSLESVDFDPNTDDAKPVTLIADIVTGFDGSGGHNQFQGSDIETPTRNIVYGRQFQIVTSICFHF